MSEIKHLDQARIAVLNRNDSEFNVPQIRNGNMSRKSIEIVNRGSNTSHPEITSRESTNNVLTQLTNNRDPTLEPLPQQVNAGRQIMTSKNPPGNLYRIIITCCWSAAGGWSDATPGAILPFIEDYYGITYAVVSLIWMANAAGFILIAMLSHKIQPWLGKRYSLVTSCICSCIMYALVSSGTHFPLVVIGFFFGGMGIAIGLSQSNIFFTRMYDLSKYLSFLHGSYGLGATLSPLIATAMVNTGVKWHYFYLITLGFMLFNGVNFYFSFKGADEDLKLWDTDESNETPKNDDPHNRQHQSDDSQQVEEAIGLQELTREGLNVQNVLSKDKQSSHSADMLLALQNYRTWLLALFVLFYQGAEVSLAGWVVTFLLDYRHGSSSVGYVASGFWGGLTLGRLLLTKPLQKILGARRAVILLSLVSICLVLLGWLLPNAIAEGVFISLAGVTIGPNYPLQIGLTAKLIPRKIQVISLTIITAFGSSGGAIFPFIVGLISQSAGTYVVMPVFIALYCCMLGLWIALPNIERPIELTSNTNKWTKIWRRIW